MAFESLFTRTQPHTVSERLAELCVTLVYEIESNAHIQGDWNFIFLNIY